jgi:lipopolysaccharide transport system ATP-binding protein
MSEIAIKVEGLGKKYVIGQQKSGDFRNAFGNKLKSLFGRNGSAAAQEFWALEDINFEIKKGEAVGIIGRNGAGKSTLLKILSRITEPTKGRFEINGRVSSLLEVGTGFHMELTGRENIYLNGTILGMRRAEIKQKLDEIIAFSGVEKFLDTPVKHYSSGMKVRLAFSVAAHLEPEILIIDEVLAVGDAEFQKKCLGKMDEVSKNEGRTVLFVSHNMAAINRLCSIGIMLEKGGVEYFGNVAKSVEKYIDAAPVKGKLKTLIENAEKSLALEEIEFRDGIVGIKIFSTRPFTNVALVLEIADTAGNIIFKTSSAPIWSNQTYFIDKRSEFEVDISQLKLIPGKYVLSFAVTVPNAEYLLKVDNVMSIIIDSPNPYKGSKTLQSGTDGYIYIPHTWRKLEKEQASTEIL